jgi:hypothetical protein
MRTDVETMVTIMAAQNAGGNTDAFIYGTASPGILAAAFIVGVLIVISILMGIFDHFFKKEE